MLDFLIKLLDKLHVFFSRRKPKEQEVAQSNDKTNTPSKKVKGMLHAKNDSQRIKDELKTLESQNPYLHDLIIDLYKWIAEQFEKDTIITMIWRSREEQDNIYRGKKRGTRLYDENPWKSPHQIFHALDIRTSIYTEEEIEKIAKYLNNKYDVTNYYKTTAMYHEVTTADGKKLGKHFHVQYVKN